MAISESSSRNSFGPVVLSRMMLSLCWIRGWSITCNWLMVIFSFIVIIKSSYDIIHVSRFFSSVFLKKSVIFIYFLFNFFLNGLSNKRLILVVGWSSLTSLSVRITLIPARFAAQTSVTTWSPIINNSFLLWSYSKALHFTSSPWYFPR